MSRYVAIEIIIIIFTSFAPIATVASLKGMGVNNKISVATSIIAAVAMVYFSYPNWVNLLGNTSGSAQNYQSSIDSKSEKSAPVIAASTSIKSKKPEPIVGYTGLPQSEHEKLLQSFRKAVLIDENNRAIWFSSEMRECLSTAKNHFLECPYNKQGELCNLGNPNCRITTFEKGDLMKNPRKYGFKSIRVSSQNSEIIVAIPLSK